MRPIRIAISGKMRSGKDTLADELVMRHGFVRMALADKLKEVARELFGAKETDKNRALLQELGRRLCRMDPAVWLKYVMDRIDLCRSIVITDLRFPNEWHALKGFGFLMVRIEIDPAVQRRRSASTEPGLSADAFEEARQDASETALDGAGWKWDLTLDGAMGAIEMYADVRLMFERLAMMEDIEW